MTTRRTHAPHSKEGTRDDTIPGDTLLILMKRQLTSAFICLRCRSVFKRPSHRRFGNAYQPLAYTPHCPHCRTVLHKVGDTFRAPAKDDFAGWTRIERAIGRGQTFVRDENFGHDPTPPRRQRTPKGVRSLFQLPARKRGRL